MIRRFIVTFNALLLTLTLSLPAFAVTLDDAKSEGLVGEKYDGYLGTVVTSASNEIRALVDRINTERRKRYQEIAEKNGIPIAEVEKLAARKAIERTQPGHFIQLPGSPWEKK